MFHCFIGLDKEMRSHFQLPSVYGTHCIFSSIFIGVLNTLYQVGKPKVFPVMEPNMIAAQEEQSFQACYLELAVFKAKHGHCQVPPTADMLYKWTNDQRSLHQRNQLPERRTLLLNAIGFEWSDETKKTSNDQEQQPQSNVADDDIKFNQHLLKLIEFRADHGNCRVEKSNKELHRWIILIRQLYKKRKLAEKKVKILESLGFEWRQKTGWEKREKLHAQEWNEKFESLVKYKQEHGHTNVPKEHGDLGSWVQCLRRHKHQSDKIKAGLVSADRHDKRKFLSDEQIEKLESIGFTWNLAPKVDWDVRYQQVIEYKNVHGHTNVPQHYSDRALVSLSASNSLLANEFSFF